MKIIECPRDAMQGIKEFIPTKKKIDYINQLLSVGFDTIDFGSFVSPKAIPQLKDTAEVLKKLKIKYVMTSKDHVSGTDRIAEAIADQNVDVIINVQADEPQIDPNLIDILASEFEDETIEMATVAGMNMDAKKLTDVNTVKVLLDRERFAVNFRRDPIESEAGGYYHHMGIYAYRKSVLDKFTSFEPSENEIKFQLEQYRALDNGIRIKVVLTEKVNKGIDTMDDLKENVGK